jgi:hypothetical protein
VRKKKRSFIALQNNTNDMQEIGVHMHPHLHNWKQYPCDLRQICVDAKNWIQRLKYKLCHEMCDRELCRWSLFEFRDRAQLFCEWEEVISQLRSPGRSDDAWITITRTHPSLVSQLNALELQARESLFEWKRLHNQMSLFLDKEFLKQSRPK